MNYINAATNQYPVSETAIRQLFPNVSFPEQFTAPSPYKAVFDSPQPEHDSVIKQVVEIAPVLTSKGHYEQAWSVVSRFTKYTDGDGKVHTVAAQQAAAIQAEALNRKAVWAQTIAARRYIAETSGTLVNGAVVNTSERGQSLITGAAFSAMLDKAYTVQWKVGDVFVSLNAAEIISMATAVRTHVQACFDREAVLLKAVTNKTITHDMVESGWPASL